MNDVVEWVWGGTLDHLIRCGSANGTHRRKQSRPQPAPVNPTRHTTTHKRLREQQTMTNWIG